jgi:hypothetical protein
MKRPRLMVVPDEPRPDPCTLLEIPSWGCRWVLPQTRDGLALMCAVRVVPGCSWCLEHHAKVFVPLQRRVGR